MIAAVIVACAQTSTATTWTTGVRDVAVIEAPSGEVRVLCKFEDVSPLANSIIINARLEFVTAVEIPERSAELQVHPVTRAWDPSGIDWDRDWSRPGGDFNDYVYSRREVELSRGDQKIAFDLSVMFSEIVEELREYHGLILTVPPYRGIGIESDLVPALARYGDATVTVEYRKLLSIPPDMAALREQAAR
jgi:hypothetical protein